MWKKNLWDKKKMKFEQLFSKSTFIYLYDYCSQIKNWWTNNIHIFPGMVPMVVEGHICQREIWMPMWILGISNSHKHPPPPIICLQPRLLMLPRLHWQLVLHRQNNKMCKAKGVMVIIAATTKWAGLQIKIKIPTMGDQAMQAIILRVFLKINFPNLRLQLWPRRRFPHKTIGLTEKFMELLLLLLHPQVI